MSTNQQDQSDREKQNQEAAANVARRKLEAMYGQEPDVKEEIAEVSALPSGQMSRHQHFMDQLSKSGRSLEEIQTAWHEYYVDLPDIQKHEVWKEFYQKHETKKSRSAAQKPAHEQQPHEHHAERKPETVSRPTKVRQPKQIKNVLLDKVNARGRLQGRHHLQSLFFGFGMGSIVILILLFSFFNERFVTPFIRPSNNISSTPIIIDPSSNAKVGPEPKIIIPKINVEAPVVFDEPSIVEKAVQRALERGVVHYATTANPGEKGNGVIFGHSSGNILNRGQYKFAFLLLKSLDEGDTFSVQKGGERYVYKVYKKFVTDPTDVSVLGATGKPSTMTLITCDPPGLSSNRLIVVGEQIFPNPAKNKQTSAAQSSVEKPRILPSNSPSLWQRLKDWF